MPLYDRHCSACDNIFEVRCKISEKETLKHACTNCGRTEGEWLVSSPNICEVQRVTSKKDTGFKEVLQKIAERNPRTNVTQQV